MKKLVILMFLLTGGVFGAGAQQTIKGDRLAPFSNVELSGKLNVQLIAAEQPSIEIKLNNADIGRLAWNVADETLSVRLKPGGNSGGNADVTIYYTAFSRIKISGASVILSTPFEGVMLDADLSAGAIFNGEFHTRDIALKITGNSVANLSGETRYLTVSASSGAKADSRGLTAEDANISASSGANVYLQGTDRIQITSETGAAVFYRGEPEVLRTTAKLMGTINNIGK